MTQHATESMTMNAPARRVYDVVVDFAHYVEWVQDMKKVEILERDAQGRALEVAFRAAAFGRSAAYTLRYDYSRAPEALTWYQVDGDLTTVLDGQYRFEGRGDRTQVTYDLAVALAVPIPNFVRSRAAHRIMETALTELKQRVEHS